MWSSERRRFLSLLAAAVLPTPLGGCLRPMLAEDTGARAMLGRIALPPVETRFDYHLRDSLARNLGEPEKPDFRLELRTRLDEKDLAITQDRAVTRISLTAIADWALFREGEAEPVLTGRTHSQSGYNSTASIFATRSVRRDVERRLARDLGERIARVLLARAPTLLEPGT